MGTAPATIITAIIIPLQDALVRSFAPELDNFWRGLKGKPRFEGLSLELQNVVWMNDSAHSFIAEFSAIFLAFAAQALLREHRDVR